MQVEEQPRNTPFQAGPQKVNTTAALLGWLCERYQTSDLVHVDPMACFAGQSAPARARVNVRVIPMSFAYCAAGFQIMADNGFPAKMSLADALGGVERATKALRPHKNPALDKKQAVAPEHYGLHAVLLNSVSLAEPLNTLPMPVAIASSVVPPVYADMKKQQTKELADELNQVSALLPSGGGVSCSSPQNLMLLPTGNNPRRHGVSHPTQHGREARHAADPRAQGGGQRVSLERSLSHFWKHHL